MYIANSVESGLKHHQSINQSQLKCFIFPGAR